MTYDDDEPEAEEYKGPWTVCLFLVDRAYGGSEEGGWYYDTGEPVLTEHLKVFNDYDAALTYRNSLRPVETEMNEGRYSVNSVLSQGEYRFEICDGMPMSYPQERPYYE